MNVVVQRWASRVRSCFKRWRCMCSMGFVFVALPFFLLQLAVCDSTVICALKVFISFLPNVFNILDSFYSSVWLISSMFCHWVAITHCLILSYEKQVVPPLHHCLLTIDPGRPYVGVFPSSSHSVAFLLLSCLWSFFHSRMPCHFLCIAFRIYVRTAILLYQRSFILILASKAFL